MADMWKQTEADNLAKRFEGVNRAKFAKEHKVKGGQAMIYNHITARSPISRSAALIYAKAFGCPLEDISPRLAAELAAEIAEAAAAAEAAAKASAPEEKPPDPAPVEEITLPDAPPVPDDEAAFFTFNNRRTVARPPLTPEEYDIIDG